jgi:hypothetical protein
MASTVTKVEPGVAHGSTDVPVWLQTDPVVEHKLSRSELDWVLRAAAPEAMGRAVLESVLLCELTNGSLWMVATDTHRMHVLCLRAAEMEGGGLHAKWQTLLSAKALAGYAKMHKCASLVLSTQGKALVELVMRDGKNNGIPVPLETVWGAAGTYPQWLRVVPDGVGEHVEPFAMNGKYVCDAMLPDVANRVVFSGTTKYRPFVLADRKVVGSPMAAGLRGFAVVMPMAVPD